MRRLVSISFNLALDGSLTIYAGPASSISHQVGGRPQKNKKYTAHTDSHNTYALCEFVERVRQGFTRHSSKAADTPDFSGEYIGLRPVY